MKGAARLPSSALRDLVIAVSLANLCFITPWKEILRLDRWVEFFRKSPSSRLDLISVPILVLLFAALFWILAQRARKASNPGAHRLMCAGFLLTLLVPINAARLQFPKLRAGHSIAVWLFHAAGPFGLILAVDILVMSWLFAAYWRGPAICRYAVPAVLMLAPFVLFTFGQATWLLATYDRSSAAYGDGKLLTPSADPASKGPRVVVMLFDEMDRGVVQASDPVALRLDSIDRLRLESLYGAAPHSPDFCTHLSIPSYLLGHLVDQITPLAPDKFELTFADGQVGQWSNQANLFSTAQHLGYRAGVVGWALPYCRMLGGELTRCWWTPLRSGRDRTAATLSGDLFMQAWNAADSVPFSDLLLTRIDDIYTCENSITDYLDLVTQAQSFTSDARLDLVMVHFPVPHPPGLYNMATRKFDCDGDYLDNFGLVDRALREVRESMEAAGTWSKSAVIVTSDHPYRTWLWGGMPLRAGETLKIPESKLYREVPFMVKLPGAEKMLRYERPFNTIVLNELALTLLRGEISNNTQLADFLDHRAPDTATVSQNACLAY